MTTSKQRLVPRLGGGEGKTFLPSRRFRGTSFRPECQTPSRLGKTASVTLVKPALVDRRNIELSEYY